jgi:Protein of unknown function DUF262/Restriction Enzyme Adenine Methylase Associated/Protein of unknown function (DUF1524)
MASGRISGRALSLDALFQGRTTYAIEYYQREFAWGPDEVRTLLGDLVEEFERADRARRSRWSTLPEFFLGPFVYADEASDRRFLVDGQQRFTTLHLIFLHLLRMAPENPRDKTRHRLTTAVVAGYEGDRTRFRLDIDERQQAKDALLYGKPFELQPGHSLTVQNLWNRSEQIADELDQRLDSDQHSRFVDWLLDRVIMIGIEAVDRDSGFRIFESMNDRGARLTSVDLMKSFLLSRAGRDEEKLNVAWREMIAEVTRRRGDSDAPKEFLRAYLIGRHADLSEGSEDARQITDAPHVWARTHANDVGLVEEGEPYHAFVSQLIDMGRAYGDLAAATVHPYDTNDREALYYNRINGVTAQIPLVLAAIQPEDTPTTIREKARVAANYVDLLVVLRAINDDSTRPDDLNQEVLDVVHAVRGCRSATELGVVLGAHLPPLDFDLVTAFGLRGDNRAQVRYILARLTAYVEHAMGQANAVQRYLADDRSWHIEHLFPDHAEQHPQLEPRRFRAVRNRLGGLGLLPAPDNTSVRDLPYAEKINWYRRHNTLLAVLAPGYEQRNPALRKLRTSHHLDKTLHAFGTAPSIDAVVEGRGQLYRDLARYVWDPARLGLAVPEKEPESSPTPTEPADTQHARDTPASRRGRRTDILGLITAGRLKPGTRLHGTHRGTRHEVQIDDNGRLWLDEDSYRLPDDAGKTATGRKTCAGWKFWHVDLADGTAVPLGEFRDDDTLRAQ